MENELENLENALDEAYRILVELKYYPAEYLYLYNKVNTWSCRHGAFGRCGKEEKIKWAI